MAQLLSEQTVLGVIATLAVLGLFVVLCRNRRVSSSVDDATLAALQRIAKATPDLRAGLTEEAANRATPHLRELLRCVAVGITDREGTMLSWDGEANEHYQDLTEAIARALTSYRREHVDHDKLACHRRGNCPMRTAVIVPLLVENTVEGALVVVGGVGGKRTFRMADEIARFVRTQLELARLDESREQLAQAEVRALRAQISPHFVYNALNTISSLIRTDPERARELLLEFAEFTRYSFRTSGLFTTLAEELRNIDRYLTLEVARYGTQRLNVRLKIAPEVLSVTVPFLVLQPLVENAVRHGLARKPGGGTVTVVAQDHGTEALISVEDDGVGMDADRLEELRDAHRSGAHVGIGNINQRMRSMFGEEYALMVETAPGAGMKVILRVPKYNKNVRAALPGYGSGPEPENTAEMAAVIDRKAEEENSIVATAPMPRPTAADEEHSVAERVAERAAERAGDRAAGGGAHRAEAAR